VSTSLISPSGPIINLAGLAVDSDFPTTEAAPIQASTSDIHHKARDPVDAGERLVRCRHLSPTVGVDDRVGREDLLQRLDVSALAGLKETND
jgi:hypothetical protein